MTTASPGTYESRQFVTMSIVVVVLHAVFLGGLAMWLWSREHYQFFPLVLIASAVMCWYRLQDAVWSHSPRMTLRVLGFGLLGLVSFALAAMFDSNWLGAFAALFCCWALIWLYGGPAIADLLRGPVFLLLLGIPLPLNLDLKLIIQLQKIATQLASQVLDLWQVRHSVSGVAIATESRSFMVEEACSGIHSLFSCVCVVVLISVLQRYGFIRILINIAQAIVWVVIANTFRVFMVVYSFSVWDVALDSGWRHELLGFVTYGIALGMSLSTDRLFLFIVPNTGHLASRKKSDPKTESNPFKRFLKFVADKRTALNNLLDRPRASRTMSLRLVLCVVLVLFAPLSAVSYGRVMHRWISTPVASVTTTPMMLGEVGPTLTTFGRMPENLDQWILVSSEQVDRDPDDPLGSKSGVFTYRGHGLEVSFSVDGFYPEWHDLAYCYTSLDWKLKDQANLRDDATGWHSTRLDLYKDDGSYMLTYFSCFDSKLMSVRPGERTIGTIRTFENLLERVGWKEALVEDDAPVTAPVFQLQLLCVTSKELLEHEQANLSQLFNKLSEHAFKALQESSE